MIKKYVNFINEQYTTGYFEYNDLPLKLDIKYFNNKIKIDILYKDSLYDNLSVDLPDSDDLGIDEFYINPNLDKDLIQILIDDGFIEKTNKVSKAGNDKTISYVLL